MVRRKKTLVHGGVHLPKLTDSNHVKGNGGVYFSKYQKGGEGLDLPDSALTNRRLVAISVGVVVMSGLVAAIFASGVFTPSPSPTTAPTPTDSPAPAPAPTSTPGPGPVPPPPPPPPPADIPVSDFIRYGVPALAAAGALLFLGVLVWLMRKRRLSNTNTGLRGGDKDQLKAHQEARALGGQEGNYQLGQLANAQEARNITAADAGFVPSAGDPTTTSESLTTPHSHPARSALRQLIETYPQNSRSLWHAFKVGRGDILNVHGVTNNSTPDSFMVPTDLGGSGNAKFPPLQTDASYTYDTRRDSTFNE